MYKRQRPRLSQLVLEADSLSEFSSVQREVGRIAGVGSDALKWPEYVLPQDRSWILNCDYDLTSTYIGMNDEIADRVLVSPGIEAIDVQLSTRVDDHADEQGE